VTGPTNGTGAYAPASGSAKFERYTPDSLADAIDRALTFSREPSARAACRTAAQAFAPDCVANTVVEFIRRSTRWPALMPQRSSGPPVHVTAPEQA